MAGDHQILPAGQAAFHVHVASQGLAPGGTAALRRQKHRGAAKQVVASNSQGDQKNGGEVEKDVEGIETKLYKTGL